MSVIFGKQRYWGIIRTSTDDQQFGLMAQKEQIQNEVDRREGVIVGWTAEHISGRTEAEDREALLKVIERNKHQRIVNIICRVDRLARNQHSLHTILKIGAEWVFLDLLNMDPTLLAIYAAFAEKFCEVNSKNTSAGMKQAAIAKQIKFGAAREHMISKAKGKEGLGIKLKPVVKVSKEAAARGRKLGMETRINRAKEAWQHLKEEILGYRKKGYSFQEIANIFNNSDNLETFRTHPQTGGKFHSSSIWSAMQYFVDSAPRRTKKNKEEVAA